MRRLNVFLLMFLVLPLWSLETTIKGDRMELLDKGDTVIFHGHVILERGTDLLHADEMRTNKERDQVTVTGNVKLWRKDSSTQTWHATGEKGFYSTKKGEGYLTGKKKKAHVVRTEIISSTASRVVHIYANRIDFLREQERAIAQGLAEGNTTDPDTGDMYEFWSTRADYDGKKKEIVLSGNESPPQPLVVQSAPGKRKTVKGDRVIYYINSKKMISDGNAQAVFVDEQPREKK